MSEDQLPSEPVGPDRGEHAHRLRRREGQVERSDLGVALARAQADTRIARVKPCDQRAELLGGDAAAEPEGIGPAPDPLPRRLPPAGVVVVPSLGNLLLVVAVLAQRDLADREHR